MKNFSELVQLDTPIYNNSDNSSTLNLINSTLEYIPYKCSYLNVLVLQDGTKSYLDSKEVREDIHWLCNSRSTMGHVLFWSTIVLGIPGNLAAFFTLITMAKSTCTFLIALLSMLDLSSILLKTTMRFLNRNHVMLGDAWCKVQQMVVNFVVVYANWVLVLICVERFVTIRFPLKKAIYLTNKRARYCAIGLGGALFPISMVFLVTHEASPPGSRRICQAGKDMRELERKVALVISALYSYIPAILLFILFGLITMALKHHRKQRKAILRNGQEETTTLQDGVHTTKRSPNPSIDQWNQLNKLERSVTGMLLVASAVFLVLTVPICILMLVKPYLKADTPVAYARIMWVYTFMRGLTFSSHAFNCYIYFLACKRFRQHMFRRMCNLCRRFSSVAKSDGISLTMANRTHIER